MKIGYARVSAKDQNLDRQIAAFASEGVEKIFQEKVSGKSTNGRTALREAIDFAREGDIFIVLSFDRLARSLHDLLNITEELNKKGVFLKSIHEDIDLSCACGKLMFSVFGAFAEFERTLIGENRREGIAAARARGATLGRPAAKKPKNWDSVITQLENKEITAVQAMKEMGLPKATFYRLLKKEEKGQ